MKILIIHNLYQQKGGEDAVFQAESKLLRQYGHAVEHLMFDNHRIHSWGDAVLAGLRCLHNPQSAEKLTEKIRAFRPDVIHVHNFFPLASPAIFYVAHQFQVPVVMTLHNYRLICPGATLYLNGRIYEDSVHQLFPWDAVRRGAYRNSVLQTASVALMTGWHKLAGTWRNRVDRYIALTEFAKNRIVNSSLGLDPAQVVVKPNFIEDPGVSKVKREDFFLFVGRLVEEKGVRVLLEAARTELFRVKIIGDGPLRAEVEACAAQHPNVEYLGYRDKPDIMDEMKRCRALVFPSLWFEGFPIVMLEALATGTPVLASELGGPGEIIQDHQNGLGFAAGSVPGLLAQMLVLSQNPRLARQLGAGARLTYEQKYTPDRNYQQLLDIYQALVLQPVALPERIKSVAA